MTAFQVDANLAFDDYPALIAAIDDWMDRNDLSGVAPQMIALAEDEIRIELEPLFQETSTTLVSASTGIAILPNDMKSPKRVLYDGCTVPQRGLTAIDRMPEGSSRPWAYTVEQNAIRLWPAGEYTVQVLYQPLLERLTDANPTNRVLDVFPSLYFYGAMTFAAGYVADDERAESVFRPMFQTMLAKVGDYYRKQRHSGPMVPRVAFLP